MPLIIVLHILLDLKWIFKSEWWWWTDRNCRCSNVRHIKKLDVHNACVVVTRYFGGIKLGGGGLIRAYSGAVRDVIYDVGRVELREAVPCIVTLNYDQTGKFEYELASTHFMLRNQTYTDKVSYYIDVVKSDYQAFINFLNQMTAGNFDLTEETQSSCLSIYQLNKIKSTIIKR